MLSIGGYFAICADLYGCGLLPEVQFASVTALLVAESGSGMQLRDAITMTARTSSSWMNHMCCCIPGQKSGCMSIIEILLDTRISV